MHPAQEFSPGLNDFMPFQGMELKPATKVVQLSPALIKTLANESYLLICRGRVPNHEPELLVVTHRVSGDRTHFSRVFLVDTVDNADAIGTRFTHESAIQKACERMPDGLATALVVKSTQNSIRLLEDQLREFIGQHRDEIEQALPKIAPFDPFQL